MHYGCVISTSHQAPDFFKTNPKVCSKNIHKHLAWPCNGTRARFPKKLSFTNFVIFGNIIDGLIWRFSWLAACYVFRLFTEDGLNKLHAMRFVLKLCSCQKLC